MPQVGGWPTCSRSSTAAPPASAEPVEAGEPRCLQPRATQVGIAATTAAWIWRTVGHEGGAAGGALGGRREAGEAGQHVQRGDRLLQRLPLPAARVELQGNQRVWGFERVRASGSSITSCSTSRLHVLSCRACGVQASGFLGFEVQVLAASPLQGLPLPDAHAELEAARGFGDSIGTLAASYEGRHRWKPL